MSEKRIDLKNIYKKIKRVGIIPTLSSFVFWLNTNRHPH